jgi:hypothetical protein
MEPLVMTRCGANRNASRHRLSQSSETAIADPRAANTLASRAVELGGGSGPSLACPARSYDRLGSPERAIRPAAWLGQALGEKRHCHLRHCHLVRESERLPLDEGLELERTLFMDLCLREEGQSLMRAFEQVSTSSHWKTDVGPSPCLPGSKA